MPEEQVVAAAGVVGEVAPLVGQVGGGLAGFLLDEGHDLFGHGHRLLGVVGDAQLEEHIGEAHDAQADFPGLFGVLLDDFQGEAVGVDDVVQEVHRGVHQGGQGRVVDGAVHDHLGQVEGAQVAGLVGQKGLLAAGVGGFDLAQVGHRVGAV
jgi:hypothetical protein